LKGVEINRFLPFEHSKLRCIDALTTMSKSYAKDSEDYIMAIAEAAAYAACLEAADAAQKGKK
jgi:hypothetical protein